METTLESTIVVSLKGDKDKEFEKIANQLGSQMTDSVPNNRGYDAWITTTRDGSKGFIRSRTPDTKSMKSYLNEVLQRNLPELQRTGQVTHNYLFGTNDRDIINSSEQATGGIKPTTYDKHIVSINSTSSR